MDRIDKKIRNRLGVIGLEQGTYVRKYRSKRLKKLQSYMDKTQYDHKMDWFAAEDMEQFIPLRQRKPFIISPLPKVHTERVNSKLFGIEVFPKFKIEDDDEAQQLLNLLVKEIGLQSHIKHMGHTLLSLGSAFCSFTFEDDALVIETHNPNHCYPEFNTKQELTFVKVQYVFEDQEDIDEETSEPKKKWYRKDFGMNIDVLYDNPEYLPDTEPDFKIIDQEEHNLEMVQGQWFKMTKDPRKMDGISVIEDITDITDSISYTLSQSDRAVEYGTDPQTVFSGMTQDELDSLTKSKDWAWVLGREGSAQFLEQSGSGVTAAQEHDQRLVQKAQEITRAIYHEPEKIIGSAQSGIAMKALYSVLVDFINEVRPVVEEQLIKMMVKMMLMLVKLNKDGAETPIIMPKGYKPKSLDITVSWGDIFPLSLQDFQALASTLQSLASANIISRETVLRILSQYQWVSVDDIDKELNRINTQKEFNQFFGG